MPVFCKRRVQKSAKVQMMLKLFHHHHHPLACCAAAASNPFRAWHTVPPLARGPWGTRSNGTMQQQAAAYGAYGFNYSEEKQGETEAARV